MFQFCVSKKSGSSDPLRCEAPTIKFLIKSLRKNRRKIKDMPSLKFRPYRDQKTTDDEGKDQTQDDIIISQRAMRLLNAYNASKMHYLGTT